MQTTKRLILTVVGWSKMTLRLTNERLRCRETLEYCLGYKFRLLSPMQHRLRQVMLTSAMHADKYFSMLLIKYRIFSNLIFARCSTGTAS